MKRFRLTAIGMMICAGMMVSGCGLVDSDRPAVLGWISDLDLSGIETVFDAAKQMKDFFSEEAEEDDGLGFEAELEDTLYRHEFPEAVFCAQLAGGDEDGELDGYANCFTAEQIVSNLQTINGSVGAKDHVNVIAVKKGDLFYTTDFLSKEDMVDYCSPYKDIPTVYFRDYDGGARWDLAELPVVNYEEGDEIVEFSLEEYAEDKRCGLEVLPLSKEHYFVYDMIITEKQTESGTMLSMKQRDDREWIRADYVNGREVAGISWKKLGLITDKKHRILLARDEHERLVIGHYDGTVYEEDTFEPFYVRLIDNDRSAREISAANGASTRDGYTVLSSKDNNRLDAGEWLRREKSLADRKEYGQCFEKIRIAN